MQKIRVLIIDGDVLMRQKLACLLRSRLDMLVSGIASDEQAARELMAQTQPDVVLLDLEGLETDSLQLLGEIHGDYPRLPIVVITTRSQTGARQAVTALECGAVEFLTKPEGTGNVLFATRHLHKRLVPAIKAVVAEHAGKSDVVPLLDRGRPLRREPVRTTHPDGRQVHMVVIGGCTGGPRALFALLPLLPEDLSVPVLIVQHMPKGYTAALAERLALKSRKPVAEGRAGVLLEPGQVWVAPGGYQMTVCRSGNAEQLDVHRGPREHDCRPSIDVLFRTAADICGPHVLAVALSGHGPDGLQGCRYIRDAGGQVLVQDEESALAWEMPGAVAQAGLAEKVLSPEALAEEITHRVQVGRPDATTIAMPVPGGGGDSRREWAHPHPRASNASTAMNLTALNGN